MQKLMLPLLAALIASGCMVERDTNGYNLDDQRFDSQYQISTSFSNEVGDNVDLLSGRLGGNIGAMRQMDGRAAVGGLHSDGYTDVQVILQNANGAAMAYLTFDGGIDNSALTPGSSLTFNGNDYGNGQDLQVYGYACSGDQVDLWDYDQPMDEIQVDVAETDKPDVVTMNFTTNQNGEQAWGSLDVAR